jgi:hypothetical protein
MIGGRYDLFVSYSSKDQPLVERLARQLQQEGVKPWLDRWELGLGRVWQVELEDALRACPASIVCLGESRLGPWQSEEVRALLDQAANDPHRLIVPVWLPEARDDIEVPLFLRGRQAIDLRSIWDAGVKRIAATIRGASTVISTDNAALQCPYRGLEAFHEEHARFMFGREAEIGMLLEHLAAGREQRSRLMVLMGASGSGKSSLVRAGLIPAVRTGQLDGSYEWRVAVLRPGARPLEALATACLRAGGGNAPARLGMPENRDPVGKFVEWAADPSWVRRAADLLWAEMPGEPRFLLVVDQFEEVFTEASGGGDSEARAFVSNLLQATTDLGRVHVVLTVRADFLPRCLGWPELATRLKQSVEFALSPLTQEQVADAVRRPALAVGADVEPAVVATLADRVAGRPGSLPLLQHCLTELWERRDRAWQTLTWTAYEQIGGLEKGIARSAERLMAELGDDRAVRRILGRLINLGEGTGDTRRVALRTELGEDSATERALAALVDKRLVTVGDGTVEIAHEALLAEWASLRGWIEENRAALRLRQEVQTA